MNDMCEGSEKPAIPLVSIGMTVYNAERFVAETLDSLLAQDYPNFELVISDNASTDGSSEICQSYADRDPRIRYYRNAENIGSVRNWNQALELARGEYFMWASDHDLWDPTYISKCVRVLDEDSDVVIAYSRYRIVDADRSLMQESPNRLDSRGIPDLVARYKYIAWNLKECTMIHGVIRTAPLRELGGFPNIYSMDDPLIMVLATYGAFAQLDEVMYSRRENRPGAATSEEREKSLEYCIKELDPSQAQQRMRKSPAELRRETRNGHLRLVLKLHVGPIRKARLIAITFACYWSRYGVGFLGLEKLMRLMPTSLRRSRVLRPAARK